MWKKYSFIIAVVGIATSVACSAPEDSENQDSFDGGGPGELTGDGDTEANSTGGNKTDDKDPQGPDTGDGDGPTGDGDGAGDGDGDGDTDPVYIPSQMSGPSRREGKAPLYVFFNGLESLEELLGVEEVPDFVNYTFLWDFDSGPTSSPETRHRYAVGFNVGHVFEEARQYVTTLTVYDPKGERVADPDDVLAWSVIPTAFDGDTIYVAATGDKSGDGSIERPLGSVLEAFEDAQPNTRILLRKGDTFDLDGNIFLEGDGPVLVEPYENADDPDAPAPVIHTNQQDADYYIFGLRTDDWRFRGIKFTGEGQTTGEAGPRNSGGVSFEKGSSNNLVIDCAFENLATIVMYVDGDSNAAFDNDIHDFGNYAFYLEDQAGQRISIVGNRVYDMGGDNFEHVLRLQLANYVFIGENHFEATRAKSNIQIRGNSGHVVVWGNVLDRTSGFRPQHDQAEERVHHSIFDSNLVLGRNSEEFDESEYMMRQTALQVAAKDLVIRNNVFTNFKAPIVFSDHPLVGTPERVDVYNNTFLCDQGDCVGVDVIEGSKQIRVFNNAISSINDDPSGLVVLRWRDSADTLTELESDYNYSFLPGSAGGATRYECAMRLSNLTNWQSLSGQDGSSLDSVDPQFKLVRFDEALSLIPAGGALQLEQLFFLSDFGKESYWKPTAPAYRHASGDVPVVPALDIYMRPRALGQTSVGAVELD
jgi:hypothetical protein